MDSDTFKGILIINTVLSEVLNFKSKDEALIKKISIDLKLIHSGELDFIIINGSVYGRDYLKACKVELHIFTK